MKSLLFLLALTFTFTTSCTQIKKKSDSRLLKKTGVFELDPNKITGPAKTIEETLARLTEVERLLLSKYGLQDVDLSNESRALLNELVSRQKMLTRTSPQKAQVTGVLGPPGGGKTTLPKEFGELLVRFKLMKPSHFNLIQSVEGEVLNLSDMQGRAVTKDEYLRAERALKAGDEEAWLLFLYERANRLTIRDEITSFVGVSPNAEVARQEFLKHNPEITLRTNDNGIVTGYIQNGKEVSYSTYSDWYNRYNAITKDHERLARESEAGWKVGWDALSGDGVINGSPRKSPDGKIKELDDITKKIMTFRAENPALAWRENFYTQYKEELNTTRMDLAAETNSAEPDKELITQLEDAIKNLESKLRHFGGEQVADGKLKELEGIIKERKDLLEGIITEFQDPELESALNERLELLLGDGENLDDNLKKLLKDLDIDFNQWKKTLLNSKPETRMSMLLDLDPEQGPMEIKNVLNELPPVTEYVAKFQHEIWTANNIDLEKDMFDEIRKLGVETDIEECRRIAMKLWNTKRVDYQEAFLERHISKAAKITNSKGEFLPAWRSRIRIDDWIYLGLRSKAEYEMIARNLLRIRSENLVDDILRSASLPKKYKGRIKIKIRWDESVVDMALKAGVTPEGNVRGLVDNYPKFFGNIETEIFQRLLEEVRVNADTIKGTTDDYVIDLTIGNFTSGKYQIIETPAAIRGAEDLVVTLKSSDFDRMLFESLSAPSLPSKRIIVEDPLSVERRATRLAYQIYLNSHLNGSTPEEVLLKQIEVDNPLYWDTFWSSPRGEAEHTFTYLRNKIMLNLTPEALLKVEGNEFRVGDSIEARSNFESKKLIKELIEALDADLAARPGLGSIEEVIPQPLRDTPVFSAIIESLGGNPTIAVNGDEGSKAIDKILRDIVDGDLVPLLKKINQESTIPGKLKSRLINYFNADVDYQRIVNDDATDKESIDAALGVVQKARDLLGGAKLADLMYTEAEKDVFPSQVVQTIKTSADKGNFGVTLDENLDIMKNFFKEVRVTWGQKVSKAIKKVGEVVSTVATKAQQNGKRFLEWFVAACPGLGRVVR